MLPLMLHPLAWAVLLTLLLAAAGGCWVHFSGKRGAVPPPAAGADAAPQNEDMPRFYGEILNNLAEGVFMVRLDEETIVYANPPFERMLGYASGELVGRHVSVLNAAGPRDAREAAEKLIDALRKNGVWVGEVHNIRRDGTTLWCQASISVFEHPEYGRTALSVHEDITARRNRGRATHERRQEMDEVQKLHVAAQTASAIAHELNQPLLAIASYSKAALLMLKSEQPDFAEIRAALEGSERQAHRAGQAIRELFDFLHAQDFPVEAFDLVREISLLIDDARLEHEWSFQSVLRVDETLPAVRANRIHVQKALFNLLRNGIEAAARQAIATLPSITITVRSTECRRFAEVTMRDNGPGIPAEIAPHLFEPFYTTKGDGFGMGLSISRSLIELNGGQLRVGQHEGRGAVFHLTIPFAEPA